MSARISFEAELKLLKKDLFEMARLIEKAIENIMIAFETQDEELAKEIIQGDRIVNDIERAIEARCLSLIIKQQPVAKDLRMVTTALKVVTDMERIGDHAADIGDLIIREKREHIYDLVKHIPEMGKAAKDMVRDAVIAFTTIDVEMARKIIKQDDIVDNLFDQVKQE